MCCQSQDNQSKNKQADTAKDIIPVRPDHIGLVDHHRIEEPVFFPGLEGLMFVQGVYQPGITGMTFIAILYCFFLWQYKVGHQYTVIDLGMAFNTADMLKMKSLVGKPVMGLYDIDAVPVSKQLELVEISMTGQTDSIVIGYGLGQVLCIPDTDVIAVVIMAFPAAELLGGQVMGTCQVFLLDLLKLVMCIIFIVAMTVEACPGLFQPDIQRVGEYGKFS
jgi:hypothetical protein